MRHGNNPRLPCRNALWIVAFLLLAQATAAGQTVTGRVAASASGAPVANAIVQLIDSANVVAVQTFSQADGEFSLRTAIPASYRVRVLRIGFRPVTSNPVQVAAGGMHRLGDIVLGAPVTLDTVHVSDRAECRDVSDGAATYAVWEQARSALVGVSMGSRSAVMNATIIEFARTLEPRGDRVREQTVNTSRGFITRTWASLPVDSLRKVGYVVTDPNGWRSFYAPDIATLLSDAFITDHCFRLATGERAGEIRIAFKPKRTRRGIIGIEGTLSLDRASSELRRLEFSYIGLTDAEEQARAGGLVEFRRMSNERWIIARWHIRMPLVAQSLVRANTSRMRVSQVDLEGVRIVGGMVAAVTAGRDTLWSGASWVLRGSVRDSLSGATIANARVALRGTELRSTSDSRGHFEIAGVLPGDFVADVQTPQLSSLGVTHTATVAISDSVTVVDIRMPDPSRIARDRCGTTGTALVAGRVSGADGAGLPGRVLAEWPRSRSQPDSAGGPQQLANQWLEVETDARGLYRFCRIPVNTDLTLRAFSANRVSASTRVRLAGDSVAIVDLTANESPARGSELVGSVLSDVNGAPILDVEVEIAGIARSTFTDANGRYRLADLPAGAHRVRVKRVGWQPAEQLVEMPASGRVEKTFVLSRVQVLEAVDVAERRHLQDFDEHRRLGLGQFLTREDLAKREVSRLTDILRSMRGVIISNSLTGTRSWLVASRVRSFDAPCLSLDNVEGALRADSLEGKTCSCFAQVYLDGARIYGGARNGIVPDLNRFTADQIEGIEYYSGVADTPLKYSTLNSTCGVLVIHTRR